MVLSNGRIKLSVSPEHGSITRIEDSETGAVHMDAGKDGRRDARLFRIIVPDEAWWSCYCDSQEQTRVENEKTANGLAVEYPNLLDARKRETLISARVEITRSAKPGEFLLRMFVKNSGQRTIIDTTFPLLGGWHDKEHKTRIALGANRFITPQSLMSAAGNNYARNGKREGWYYPVDLACPWFDFSGKKGGLAYTNYMREGRNGKFWIENLAGYGDDFRLMFGWSHFAAIRPGDTWTSPVMGLMAHGSDWRAAAENYGEWFDKHSPPDYSRPDVRSRIGFQNIFVRGFNGKPINNFDIIPQAASDGRHYGVDMLSVWDMLTLGNYARHDAHDLTDYSNLDKELLRKNLRLAEKGGTRTCALINFRHPNIALHLHDRNIENRIKRSFAGTFQTENFTGSETFADLWAKHIGPESYVFSPFSDFHRERVARLTREYLELGYSSMFYDQPFEHFPDYGFIERGHQPDSTHSQALQIVRDVRKALLSRDSQAVIIGEESDIHATPYIDQWMSWSIADPSPELLDRVSMMRYSMPHTMLSWVVDHEPERAAIAFAMGMQLCLMVHGGETTLAAEPAFAEKVKAMAVLRQKTAARTVMARFIGHDGLEIDGERGFHAYVYNSAFGPAVIAAACGHPARGKVKLDPEVFPNIGGSKKGILYPLGGGAGEHQGAECEFSLNENEVMVWTL